MSNYITVFSYHGDHPDKERKVELFFIRVEYLRFIIAHCLYNLLYCLLFIKKQTLFDKINLIACYWPFICQILVFYKNISSAQLSYLDVNISL